MKPFSHAFRLLYRDSHPGTTCRSKEQTWIDQIEQRSQNLNVIVSCMLLYTHVNTVVDPGCQSVAVPSPAFRIASGAIKEIGGCANQLLFHILDGWAAKHFSDQFRLQAVAGQFSIALFSHHWICPAFVYLLRKELSKSAANILLHIEKPAVALDGIFSRCWFPQ